MHMKHHAPNPEGASEQAISVSTAQGQAISATAASGQALDPQASQAEAKASDTGKKDHLGWIMVLYLLGLFLGSLNMGVITPVRTIIQSSLGVDAATGIWMINIFTLMYAAVIPISGKLADRHGRKIVFLISIFLFGVGSLLAGLANSMDSFAVLIAGRVIQGLGAGGIMPIATAEFGTSFPPEKRGMALGLVGGVYGIGSVLGATMGSVIVDIFGAANWQWVFYMNLPFCIFIILAGLKFIPNHKAEQVFKIDKLGTLLMVVIIISLLYGLKNVDFFNFIDSITQWEAWAFLLLAVVLIPFFVIVEKRAEDPIFHIEYMQNKQIVLTLLIGLLVGMVMMGMVFIPQFAENALKMSSGAGGYFVIVLGLFAGVVSPVSGTLIDRFGEKGVMLIGLVISALGGLYLAIVAVTWPNTFNVIVSLVLIGLGMGFTMGTPLNYMMMANTKEEESNSALATLSLVRSIGTAIAPALMVGFIIQAASGLQTDLMKALPEISNDVKMEQQATLNEQMDELLAVDDELQALLATMDTETMESMGMNMSQKSVREQFEEMGMNEMLAALNGSGMNMDMDMDSGNTTMPADLLEKMQNSDVTTIVPVVKELVDWVFDEAMSGTIEEIQNGIQQGIDGIGSGISGIGSGISGIGSGIATMQTSISQMEASASELQAQIDQMQQAVAGMTEGVNARIDACNQMESAMFGMRMSIMSKQQQMAQLDPESEEYAQLAQEIGQLQGQIAGMEAAIDEMYNGENGINATKATIASMESGIAQMTQAVEGIQSGVSQMTPAVSQMQQAQALMQQEREIMGEMQVTMTEMKDGIPGYFALVKTDYQGSIDENSEAIENVYQKSINEGYRNMFILVSVLSIVALILLLFYKQAPRDPSASGGHGHGMGHGHGKKKDGKDAAGHGGHGHGHGMGHGHGGHGGAGHGHGMGHAAAAEMPPTAAHAASDVAQQAQ